MKALHLPSVLSALLAAAYLVSLTWNPPLLGLLAQQLSSVPSGAHDGMEHETVRGSGGYSQSVVTATVTTVKGLLSDAWDITPLHTSAGPTAQRAFEICQRKGCVLVRERFTGLIFFYELFHSSSRELPSHDIYSFIHSVHIYSVLHVCCLLCEIPGIQIQASAVEEPIVWQDPERNEYPITLPQAEGLPDCTASTGKCECLCVKV